MKTVITGGQGTLAQECAQYLRGEVLTPSRNELDVTDPQAIASYFSGLHDVELLLCNAAVIKDQLLLRMNEQTWDTTIETNLNGAFRCAQAFAKQKLSQQGKQGKQEGHILFFSSYSAYRPHTGQCNYAASKASLIGLTKSLAKELGMQNIRVNCILPGFIPSAMTTNLSEAQRNKILNQHTLGRFNTAKQVAEFIQFLHLHLPHTSGQVFNLDSRILPDSSAL